ncbi:hypothetical protein [Breznakia pachnodae]|uniref:Uncharacterized protein n=1 Tax=Breznakia pachnodae TaxID=265178 RepID=A0ABU0E3V1_9FIRM|nr:hypothetical protein [Breznakia pachnodae]MDQ0361567.1 hypothetical protein [Breznakia pachnodae]
MGFNINIKLLDRKENGELNAFPIKGSNGKTYEFVKVNLPSNVNFGGFKDNQGNEIFGVSGASVIVPKGSIMQDKYNEDKAYINLKGDYVFKSVNIDLGLTGRKLEDGKNEHNFSKLENVPIGVVEDSFAKNQWHTFTITPKMRGTDYITQEGDERTTVVIPAGRGELSGGRFTVSPKNITPVKDRDDLLQVAIHRDAVFTIMKSEEVGINPDTGKKEYSSIVMAEKVTAKDLAEYYKKPEEKFLTRDEQSKDHEEKDEAESANDGPEL